MDDALDLAGALDPGQLNFDLGLAADLVAGYGYLDVSSRLSDGLSLVARGEAGVHWATSEAYAAAYLALRGRF